MAATLLELVIIYLTHPRIGVRFGEMKTTESFPQTLLEAVRYFSDPDTCLAFMVEMRWPNGVSCPRCNCPSVSFVSTRRIWKCKGCRKQFSAKVGTIFEDSPIGFEKWLPAVWMIVNDKNGVSSYEIHREIGVTQKTAWFMMHRIRLAMRRGTFSKLSGQVESNPMKPTSVARRAICTNGERTKLSKAVAPLAKLS